MDKEKLIDEIMREAEKDGEPLTREEAMEIAEMEIKAKGIKNYTQSAETAKERKPRERKVDEDKATILENLKRGLTLLVNSAIISVENENKLHFKFNGNDYTVNLIKHRTK